MRKRYFLLLEILIAVTLMAACMIPLIRTPLCFYKHELKNLKHLEKQRIENDLFIDIQTKLFKNEIPWNTFSCMKKDEAPIHSIRITLPNLYNNAQTETQQLYYRIWTKASKEITVNNKTFRKISIQISLNEKFKKNKKYVTRHLFVKKLPLTINSSFKEK